jgi:hypothetical protein
MQEISRVAVQQVLSLGPSQYRCRIWFPDSLVRVTPPRADLGLKSLPCGEEAVSDGTFLAHVGCSIFRLALWGGTSEKEYRHGYRACFRSDL